MNSTDKHDYQIKNILHLIAGKRRELKITQTEMGEVLGLSLNSYRLIELGGTQLKLNILLQISEKLGLDFLKENIISDKFTSEKLTNEEGEKWTNKDEDFDPNLIYYKDENGNKARYININRGEYNEAVTKKEYSEYLNQLANNRFHNRKLKVVKMMKDFFEEDNTFSENQKSKKIITLNVLKDAITYFFPKNLTKKEIDALILLAKEKDTFFS